MFVLKKTGKDNKHREYKSLIPKVLPIGNIFLNYSGRWLHFGDFFLLKNPFECLKESPKQTVCSLLLASDMLDVASNSMLKTSCTVSGTWVAGTKKWWQAPWKYTLNTITTTTIIPTKAKITNNQRHHHLKNHHRNHCMLYTMGKVSWLLEGLERQS